MIFYFGKDCLFVEKRSEVELRQVCVEIEGLTKCEVKKECDGLRMMFTGFKRAEPLLLGEFVPNDDGVIMGCGKIVKNGKVYEGVLFVPVSKGEKVIVEDAEHLFFLS